MSQRTAIALLSGGLDSATTAAVAHREGFRVHALTIRYGQSHALEVERARILAVSLGVAEHRVIDLDIAWMGGSALTDPELAIPLDRDDEAIATDQGCISTPLSPQCIRGEPVIRDMGADRQDG